MKKVFISYCWKRYDEFVEKLATKLLDNYDVIFDKWEIKHGHNMDYFMENSIRNADKVFVLCESEYVKKANHRVSGVGIETSIISSKVYRDNIQEKFIPVFLEGTEIKPDYMESIFGIEVNPNAELEGSEMSEFINALEGKAILEKPKFDTTNINDKIEIPVKIENKSLNEKLENGIFDSEVYVKIKKVINEGLIAKFIVKYQLYNFGDIVMKFDESNQLRIMNSIEDDYVDATGYNGWSNYDIFGKIAYVVGMASEVKAVKSIAGCILEGCAHNRYNLQDMLDDFNLTNL